MVFHLFQAVGMQLEAAYGRRMVGAGPSYRERQQGRIQCTECREEMALGFLKLHMQTQHGMEAGRGGIVKPHPPVGSHVPTGWSFRPPVDRGTAPLRGVCDRWRQGQRCGFTFSTGVSRILSSFCSRETSPTHGATDESC